MLASIVTSAATLPRAIAKVSGDSWSTPFFNRVVSATLEIGTLRAIGLRQLGIRQLFVTEGVLLGLGGAVLGASTALLISAFVNRLGLEWLPPGSAEPLPLILRVWGEPGMILGTTLGLIVIATLSAWWPAYRAARLNVVDALRHV